MTQSNPGTGILEAARKLQQQKLTAVERLVDTRSRIAVAESQLADAQREDANAYRTAQDAGWSEQELKAVGIAPPAKPGPGRPRTSSTPRARARTVPDGARDALADAQLRREAEASVRMDSSGDGQTHVVAS